MMAMRSSDGVSALASTGLAIDTSVSVFSDEFLDGLATRLSGIF